MSCKIHTQLNETGKTAALEFSDAITALTGSEEEMMSRESSRVLRRKVEETRLTCDNVTVPLISAPRNTVAKGRLPF